MGCNISGNHTVISKTIVMLVLSLMALGLGIQFYLYPSNRVFATMAYDKLCQAVPSSAFCELSFNIFEEYNGPISIFYRLPNFISNHKDYILSKSLKQLQGENVQRSVN